MKKFLGMLFACALMTAFMVPMVSCGDSTTTVNLNDYVIIEADGYDGYGTVSYTFDSDAFLNDYSQKISFKAESGSDNLSISATSSLISDIENCGSFTKNTRLENGEEIVFKWTFDPQTIEGIYAVNLKYGDIDYTVSTLEDLEPVDVFENVSIEFSGISSIGEASLAFDEDQTGSVVELPTDIFSINPTGSLSNGDTVTLEITDAGVEYLAENYRQKPIETSKDYTVAGLYTFTEVPEDMLNTAQELCLDEFYENRDYFEGAHDWNHYEKGLPTAYLKVKDQNGNQLLDTAMVQNDDSYDWTMANRWLAMTDLESINYVGNYFTIYGTSEYRLYLVYDVCFSQYGSTDEDNPTPVSGGRSDFEYHWCPYISMSIDYDDQNLACSPEFRSDDPSVTIIGDTLEYTTYYISDASTNKTSENTVSYIGYPVDDNLTNNILSYYNGEDMRVISSDFQ